ncbi:MAG TPA: rhomboid family intramembrane serine protease, partial [Gemmatimonadaceae bacterium]|nr:rhomboid family intramembrane serine protease [Gemmatimonadaceae bacterium]
PWVRALLIANVAVYFLQKTVPGLTFLLEYIPALTLQRPWTLVTYMFVHSPASLMHLLFNMLALFFFGPRVEERLGSRGFLWLYLVSGLAGAAFSSLFTPGAAIIGASAAVYGVMLAFARFWPTERIYIWGILPVEARLFVLIMTGLSLYGGFSGGSGVAHFAHLGGFAGGLFYLLWWERRRPGRAFRKRATQAAPPPPKEGWQPTRWQPGGDASSTDLARWRGIRRDGMHSLNKEELDRILDKINEKGLGSLTPDERAFLERMSARS